MPDEIDQKRKVDQNTWFFLRFFSPPHFSHWKLRYELLKVDGWVVVVVGHLIIVSLQVLPFEFLTLNVEY